MGTKIYNNLPLEIKNVKILRFLRGNLKICYCRAPFTLFKSSLVMLIDGS
jgi:hypothetical protein